jgi:hypothetical protein
MDRREALRLAASLAGAAFVASNGVLAACAPRGRTTSSALTGDDQDLIEEIADTLLPTTAASPGAKAARVGAAINLLLTDCYDAKAQRRVVQGLKDFRATCRERKRADFTTLSRSDREQLLREIDTHSKKVGSAHYFGLFRELATGAYFSSQIGTTQALRWVAVPGRFEGCVPLKPGQPAWA